MTVETNEEPTPAVKPLSLIGKFLWVIGIVRSGGTPETHTLKTRFYVLVALVILGISSFGGLLVYSTAPSFCRSCHIMEPYYQAWANSKHKNVACVQCHYPPGAPETILWKKFQALSQVAKYVTRTYSSKPFAEVEDASCLRSGCHSTRLMEGKLMTEKGIKFDHKPHLTGVRKGRQLRCVSCHSQVVVGKHIEVTWDSCFLCHLKGAGNGREIKVLGGCLGCHDLPDKEFKMGNIAYNHKTFLGSHQVSCDNCHQDVILGEGKVVEDKCLTCHNEPEKVKKFDDIPFIHDNHVTKHNTACFQCHEVIKHGVTQAGHKQMTLDCRGCHVEMHDLPKNLYMGVGAKGIPPMPSPMYLSNVDCVGCHQTARTINKNIGGEKTFEGSEVGCVKCHSEKYSGLLNNIHILVNETVAEIEGKIATISAALTEPTASHSTDLADAIYNLDFVKATPAAHNVYYVSQILRVTDEKLGAIARDKNIKIEDSNSLPLISGNFCATLCHKEIGVKVPANKKKYKGKVMPHKKHLKQGLVCTSCHVFGQHKDVRLKEKLPCSECHGDDMN